MRIGVNALYLIPGGVGGTEVYIRVMLEALAAIDRENQYVVFTNRETGASITPAQANFETCRTGVPARWRSLRILYEQLRLPRVAARARRCDVLFNPGFTAPLAGAVPSVTVLHDLQHMSLPHHFRWYDLPFWKLLVRGAAERSRHLIAISEFTRQDILRFYDVPPEKVTAVHHGFDAEFTAIAARRRTLAPPEPYLLCVSTLHPHKNIERLVRVFTRFRAAHPGFRLVLAGLRGFQAGQVEREIDRQNLRDAVTITGWIERRDLYALFERAWTFVYPSTFEGFGLPVLEALAAGLPTVATAIPAIREVAGDAALLVDPYSDDALLEALECASWNVALRARMADEGPLRASAFSWERAARRTLEILERAAAAPRATP